MSVVKENLPISFTLSISGKTQEISVDLNELMDIDEDNIRDVLSKHPGNVAWFGALLATYQKQLNSEKDSLKLLEAELYESKRQELEDEGAKATEASIKSRQLQDPSYVLQLKRLREAEMSYNMLVGIKVALDHKRDCLVQISGFCKREMDLNTYAEQVGGANEE